MAVEGLDFAINSARNRHSFNLTLPAHLGGPVMLIKLNDKGVRVYSSRLYQTRTPLDWRSRIGRVAMYSRNRSFAYVVWNGRRSCDRILVDLIEPASAEGNSCWRPSQSR